MQENFYCEVHSNYRPLSSRCVKQCDKCKQVKKKDTKSVAHPDANPDIAKSYEGQTWTGD